MLEQWTSGLGDKREYALLYPDGVWLIGFLNIRQMVDYFSSVDFFETS